MKDEESCLSNMYILAFKMLFKCCAATTYVQVAGTLSDIAFSKHL